MFDKKKIDICVAPQSLGFCVRLHQISCTCYVYDLAGDFEKYVGGVFNFCIYTNIHFHICVYIIDFKFKK